MECPEVLLIMIIFKRFGCLNDAQMAKILAPGTWPESVQPVFLNRQFPKDKTFQTDRN